MIFWQYIYILAAISIRAQHAISLKHLQTERPTIKRVGSGKKWKLTHMADSGLAGAISGVNSVSLGFSAVVGAAEAEDPDPTALKAVNTPARTAVSMRLRRLKSWLVDSERPTSESSCKRNVWISFSTVIMPRLILSAR